MLEEVFAEKRKSRKILTSVVHKQQNDKKIFVTYCFSKKNTQ